jgi:hypothetical protein
MAKAKKIKVASPELSSVVDQVKSCKSTLEALAILASAIDQLKESENV